jgi:prolyl-tRNA synthetase
MGALVMTHSDDYGLVLPPKLAPIHVAIVPIYKGEEQLAAITEKVNVLKKDLFKKGISVKFDDRDTHKPGWKFAEYEFKGVPVRVAIGPRDLENNQVEIARRDTLEKQTVSFDDASAYIENLLDEIQRNLYDKAKAYRDKKITEVNSWDEFQRVLESEGGFLSAHWDGTAETEQKIKEATKATIRCIPLDQVKESGVCVFSGKPSQGRVLFAKAY